MKKEFITYWSPEKVLAKINAMPIPRARFFSVNKTSKENVDIEIIIPDDIRHDDLCFFIGRKTRVTIETID